MKKKKIHENVVATVSILELGAWLFQLGCDNGWVPGVHPITDLEEVHGQKGHHLQVQSSKRVLSLESFQYFRRM